MELWVIAAAAVAVLDRRAWPGAAGLAFAIVWPMGALAGLTATWLWHRRLGGAATGREISFHHRTAAALRSGAVLRSALILACESDGDVRLRSVARRLRAGRPFTDVADDLRLLLPVTAPLASAAVELSMLSGGRTVDTFMTLAELASDEAALLREVQQSAASGRFALFVIGGLPVVGLAFVVVTGRFAAVVGLPGGPAVLALGVCMLVAGGAAATVLIRRAGR